ncbi:hypothetical protein EIP86_004621 [Pleurotus ostreatoroseus]|nr:hypothetical protein EIP86_004621 [Pleurotus ostreatoroseus]
MSSLPDCEYTDGGPTQSQILEQNIAGLEARIRELEGGDAAVTLHDPHAVGTQPVPTAVDNTRSTERIIQSFLDHANTIGFFLHRGRFVNKLAASIPPTEISPLPASLVHATYLIGVMCTNDPILKQQEPQILSRALRSLTATLNPAHVIYMLQAEVLLTYYLFHQGRILEGGYHAAAAASIAVACRLHKIRSVGMAGQAPTTTADVLQLPPPTDSVGEGERVQAFWNVFIVDRYWSVWSQSPSALVQEASPSMQVDTPWPMEMEGYEQVSKTWRFATVH